MILLLIFLYNVRNVMSLWINVSSLNTLIASSWNYIRVYLILAADVTICCLIIKSGSNYKHISHDLFIRAIRGRNNFAPGNFESMRLADLRRADIRRWV